MRAGQRWLQASITRQLVLVMTLCMTLILVATLGFNDRRSRALIEDDLEREARALTQGLANHVQGLLLSVSKATEGLRLSLEEGQSVIATARDDVARNGLALAVLQDRIGEKALRQLLERTLESNPEIDGLAAAFEPTDDARAEAMIEGGYPLFAPYVYRGADGAIAFKRIEAIYDYAERDWYRITRERERPAWSDPYLDEVSDQLMATFALPFFEPLGETHRLAGLLAANVALDRLTEALSVTGLLRTGFAFLVSDSGTLIAHSMERFTHDETIFSLASKAGEPAMQSIGQSMLRGESGFVEHTAIFGFDARLFYAPIHETGWSLVTVFPEQELFADVRHLTLITSLIGGLGILVAMATIALIAGSIRRPLRALVAATQRIAAGDFEVVLPDRARRDEIGALTRAFETMQQALRARIRELISATAARERIESELQVARRIQLGILPKLGAPNLDARVALQAAIRPAREVGGDFYDFFALSDGRLCLVIADVSDKGMPAALFMAVTRTLIKAHAQTAGNPADILVRVNRELAHDNPQNMFVTVFCGLLDPSTGELLYANAGHNPPLRLSHDGLVTELSSRPQLVLGALEAIEYCGERLTLSEGERLFLFTDGVTEACNAEGALYSGQRLRETLRGLSAGSPSEIVDGVLDSLGEFVGATPQADDITVLLVEFKSRP
jgi:sigma-B regulation protein RsbU (phosphoserine phosphatase)